MFYMRFITISASSQAASLVFSYYLNLTQNIYRNQERQDVSENVVFLCGRIETSPSWASLMLHLLQLGESRAVVAPFGGVLQVLAQSTGQRGEDGIQILHCQLGAAQRRKRRRRLALSFSWAMGNHRC